MFIFKDFLLMLLFTICFIGFYFIYEKILSILSLNLIRLNKYIIETISGLVFGGVSLLINIAVLSFNKDFKIPMFFIIGMILLLIKNEYISLISATILLLYYLFSFDIKNSIIYLIILFYSLEIIYTFTNHFFLEKIAKIVLFTLIILTSLVSLLVIGLILEKEFSKEVFQISLEIPISFFALYMPLIWGINFSISANLLFESTHYVYSNYYRYSLCEIAIGNDIQKNKIKYGIYGLFKINTNDDEITIEIRNHVLSLFENVVPKETTLFAYKKNIYGFFIPKKTRQEIFEDVAVSEIENYMQQISKKNTTIDKKTFTISTFSAISFYGKTDNTISKLQDNVDFEIKNMDSNKDIVSIFKFNDYRTKLRGNRLAMQLDKRINLESFNNEIIKLYYKNNLKFYANYIYVGTNQEVNITESINDLLKLSKWKNTFNKFYANNAIKKYMNSKGKFLIEYSPFVLDDDFNVDIFKKKLHKYNINNNKIIFYFSYEDIIEKNKLDFIANVISKEFNIALTNFSKAKVNDLKKIKPIALINNSKMTGNWTKFSNYKIINTKINTFDDYQNINLKYTDIIGGILLNNSSNFKIIEKQSKIKINREVQND